MCGLQLSVAEEQRQLEHETEVEVRTIQDAAAAKEQHETETFQKHEQTLSEQLAALGKALDEARAAHRGQEITMRKKKQQTEQQMEFNIGLYDSQMEQLYDETEQIIVRGTATQPILTRNKAELKRQREQTAELRSKYAGLDSQRQVILQQQAAERREMSVCIET